MEILVCFLVVVQVGSTDSLYEPPYHSQGLREVLPGCGYSPAPLRPTGPGWGGSDPCISPVNNEGGDKKAIQVDSGVTDRDLPTLSAESDLRTAEPHRKLKRFHRLLLVKKASQSEAGKGKNTPQSDGEALWTPTERPLHRTHVALTSDSPLMSCMGSARKSGKHSPRQGKPKNGRVGNAGEKQLEPEDDAGDQGESLWIGGPHCHYWRPVGLPQMWTAASVHTPQHRAPGGPWDSVCHGALGSRTAPWDPFEAAAGGLEGQPTKGCSPAPAPPSMRDEEDTAESTEMGQGDRSQDKVSGGHMFTGGRPSRSSNSLESLYSLNSGQSSSSGVTSGSTCSSNRNSLRLQEENLLYSRQCCARARVHTDFVPSPYDMESLRLKVGDVIDVIAKPTMGIWTGMLNGKIGSFKFVYVDVLEDRESDKYQSHKQRAKSKPETVEDLLKPHSLEECCSILRLHGYRGVEDLARLREHHLMDEIGPEDRRRLLAAVEALREPQCGSEWGQRNETPTGSGAVDPRTRPRDSGCHVPSDGSDNGRDDSEINFPFISPATLDQISAV
ncbi:SAM and SH3 domain-containing protein 3 [Merluccius polli]|uniref:SAM and SH3 domain-containing protein 3 n=1 Tax=Merluccius polli TaxID=89951 RepID=A0AA47P5I2_MERPO|nr:SAM and SH3 domain-containing protein 3 [Merluccius polli]